MNRLQLRALLDQVQSGALTPESAHDQLLQYLRHSPFENLEFARIDHHRSVRQGFPEVVYGAGKTPEQIAAIAERIVAAGHNLLVTRTNVEAFDAVRCRVPAASFHEHARTITLRTSELPAGRGTILVVAAGTADLPVAEEAVISAEIMGNRVERLYDVGVAGLHRLLAEQNRLNAAHVVIVVAGMEGALPSVVGGLVDVPVIAVPTSVGYGASFGGITALLGMLNSCASGISVVNIDNGFGAAAVANAINHLP
ncbi:MAG: nickel pincer cofactor biosynthesis protein LarB [Acidobacteria bacterium]|nr:nickel pincer cofactor biosynthesis protein LarB [Acidobacteriota bacterium]